MYVFHSQRTFFDESTKESEVEEVNGTALILEMADQVAQMLGNKTAALKVHLYVVFTYHNSTVRRLLEGQRNLVYTKLIAVVRSSVHRGRRAWMGFRGNQIPIIR